MLKCCLLSGELNCKLLTVATEVRETKSDRLIPLEGWEGWISQQRWPDIVPKAKCFPSSSLETSSSLGSEDYPDSAQKDEYNTLLTESVYADLLSRLCGSFLDYSPCTRRWDNRTLTVQSIPWK